MREDLIAVRYRIVKRRGVPPPKPPLFASLICIRIAMKLGPLWFDLSFKNLDEVGPPSGFFFGHICEVDDKPMIAVSRIGIDFFTTEIGEYALSIAVVLIDQPIHLRNGRGDSLLVRVIEGKPHPENEASRIALSGVGLQADWIVTPASMEKVRSNLACRTSVQEKWAGQFSSCNVNDANDVRLWHLHQGQLW